MREQVTFIRIEHTLKDAMAYYNSPQEEWFIFDGVQILPDDPLPYIQRTHNPQGIELEDITYVIVRDLCGKELATITDSFSIRRVFQDINGLPQVDWWLKQIDQDFGDQLVYLEILNGLNDYFYTSPFKITRYESDFTARVDYKNKESDTMLSSRVKMYFRQPVGSMSITTYSELSTGMTATNNSKYSRVEKWRTGQVHIYMFELFMQLFLNKVVYVDLVRSNLQEAFEYPELEMDENFSETDILLSRNYNDKYDPLYVAPTPPLPPPTPSINLTFIENAGANTVRYVFDFDNLSPSFLIYQWSTDQISWNEYSGSAESPQEVNINGYQTGNFYYRIFYPPTGTYSNTIQYFVGFVIDLVKTPDPAFNPSGNIYNITWHAVNMEGDGIPLYFEGSKNGGVTWNNLYYGYQTASPKQVKTPASSSEYTHFRMRSSILNLTSNTFIHQF